MTPKALALGLTLVAALSGTAQAETRVEAIARHLAEQGYHDIEIGRTFLGRARIEAEKNGMEREIIVNPRTGEILRDYWEEDDEHKVLGGSADSEKSERTSSGVKSDDLEDDIDDDEDDADDDNDDADDDNDDNDDD
ncbi:hypothetical protein [uncultured Shimia sp.]|uniref:hypothetical protein n=1 Tax=uncultured Shimia sp. TaxID=573152 RepID=UPI00261FFC0E|nr:hypothetical protein [uncultured Shimia sp.]